MVNLELLFYLEIPDLYLENMDCCVSLTVNQHFYFKMLNDVKN